MLNMNAVSAASASRYQNTLIAPMRRGSLAPVEPVPAVDAINNNNAPVHIFMHRSNQTLAMTQTMLPDNAVAMAVRGRMNFFEPAQIAELTGANEDKTGLSAALPSVENGEEAEAGAGGLAPAVEESESKSPAEFMEEQKCETCENRRYQDGSDDPGVSYKSATKIAPERVASEVRSHEMEHVVREQAEAQREGRKVVSQSVTLHTDICPDCGRVYISGGTTRTTTSGPVDEAAAKEAEQAALAGAPAEDTEAAA